MKNIKVNIINHLGKPTSTTININIALTYYKYCISDADKVYIKAYDLERQYDAAVSHRNKVIQDFVNKLLMSEKCSNDNFHINKDYIELRLLHAIAFSDPLELIPASCS